MADQPGIPTQFGLDTLQKYGNVVNGGSSVQAGTGFDPSAYLGGGGFQAKPGTPTSTVYMGGTPAKAGKVYDPDTGAFRQVNTPAGKKTLGYQEASLLPTQWDEKQKRDFISKGILYKMPGFGPNMGMPEIMKTWGDLVDAAQTLSQSGKDWSPWDVMGSYATDGKKFGTIRKGDWEYDAMTGEKIKYVGPRTKTTTSKNVNLSSAEDVKALTTQMLTELLGRAPTTKELSQYRSSINGYEENNPEMTTTTQKLNDQGEVVSQSQVTAGGASQAALGGIVSEQARKGPEYGKYQSGTTYYNALMQMIAGG